MNLSWCIKLMDTVAVNKLQKIDWRKKEIKKP